MKKSLLTIGLIGASMLVKSQILSYVGEGATITIKENTLVYSGGGMKIVGSGKVDNYGNVMVVGSKTGTADQFVTENTDGSEKINGGNFVLKLSDPTNFASSTYGQLYIENILQGDIKATVDKEYRATKNGSMQQMALPFYNKSYASLGTELGNATGFAFSGRSTNAIGYWEDKRAVMHNISASQTTLNQAPADNQSVLFNNAARYYAIGTANWNPELPTSGNYYTVKGKPYSSNVGTQASPLPLSYTLKDAGYITGGSTPVPIAYGVGTGNANNGIYNEKYKTYLQDAFDIPSQGFYNSTIGTENGNFGRNMYQFGNPFLTNIDLSKIGYDEGANGDGNAVGSIQGVRYESIGVNTSNTTGTHATSYKFITYDTNGIPAGDFSGSIIKPMQAFVIKLRNNTNPQTLNFNTLRRFAYTPRVGTTYDVTAAKSVNANKNTNGTLKQLGVIGLNANGEEVARTYFVVGPDAKTGHDSNAKLQVSAFSGALSTREELPTGGENTAFSDMYWLYINEANQNDFVGKKVRMVKGSSITQYKFELAEDAVFLNDGGSTFVDGGKSFYIEQTPGTYVQISNNQIIGASTVDSGLYYGAPNSGTLSTIDAVTKDDALEIAYEKNSDAYYVIFPKSWKNNAKVTIFDMSGRIVNKNDKVTTDVNYKLPIKEKAGYLVEVISDKGQKVSKKIVK